jgi:hypothetical protein
MVNVLVTTQLHVKNLCLEIPMIKATAEGLHRVLHSTWRWWLVHHQPWLNLDVIGDAMWSNAAPKRTQPMAVQGGKRNLGDYIIERSLR